MVEYTCEKCAKVFKQKGHYDQHKSRKNTCVIAKNLDALIEEKIQKLIGKTDITALKIDDVKTPVVMSTQ